MTRLPLVIVGGGPAGMAAALAAREAGVREVLLLERDQFPGGVLNQCIHPGFGLEWFKEELTGPEYAQRFIEAIRKDPGIRVSLRSFVTDLSDDLVMTIIRPGRLERIRAGAVILATGCRERTREMIPLHGTRPAGVFPAGLAQKMMNIEGLLPGREVVVIGSGDIGLIMARRLSLEGAEVKAVVEIRKESRGLARNIVQCLEDFGIPLLLSHRVSEIRGKDRVESVIIGKVDGNGCPLPGSRIDMTCDTVLVSVGLIPENELAEKAGVKLDPATNGPASEKTNLTNIPGLFVCGNAFRVYDIADSATKDSTTAGQLAAKYLSEVVR